MNKTTLFLLGGLMALAIVLGACQGAAPAIQQKAPAAPAAGSANTYGLDHKMRVIFVTHDLSAGVFSPVRRGMQDACTQINADCEFRGPQTYDLAKQVAMIDAAIAEKPDAIVITRPDPRAYNAVTKKALDAGILVAAFNTNDPKADAAVPIPFVGQDFTNYGKVWAHEIMKDLPDGGDIAITDCCPGHYALDERNRSMAETLQKEGNGKWKVRQIINTGAEHNGIYMAIEAFYKANPDIKGIYGSDFGSHIISEFIKNNDLQGKLKTGGSDIGPGNQEGLKEGYTSFALGQNPYWQGYMPVMMLQQEEAFGVRPSNIDTGTDVVTPQNYAQYNPNYR